MLAIALATVVVGFITVVTVVVVRDSDETASSDTTGAETPVTGGPASVELQAFDAPGPDPFTVSVATLTTPVTAGGVSGIGDVPGTIQRVPGASPGLFAGNGNPELCDLEALQRDVAADPASATAFAAAVGIPTDALGSWVANLTPVVLREDTRVTSHRFRDAQAIAFPAVLQAGTAVAVDPLGAPRLRCVSGSPLTEAQPAASDYAGAPWTGFNPNRITAVAPADAPLTELTLTDLTTGRLFDQPTGARTLVSDRAVMGVPFGTRQADAMARFTAILGPPDETERIPCPGSTDQRTNHFWGAFGVRFERDRLDAWIATDPTLTRFTNDRINLGLSPRLLFAPVAPGMSVAEMDDALDLARERNPSSWLARATDSGLIFLQTSDQWQRFIAAERTPSSGPIDVAFSASWTTGNPATALLVSVVTTGVFPPGEQRPGVCFGSDVSF